MKKISTKILSITLALCMAISIIPVSAISSSAATQADDIFSWSASELVSRGFQVAGKIMVTLGSFTNSQTVRGVSSFINNYVLSDDGTAQQLSEIQNTCNEILKTTENTYSVVEDINKKISDNTINVSHKECDDAFEEQVLAYTTRYDNSSYDFYNVYIAYIEYLNYACSDENISQEKLKSYENAYLKELRNYYTSVSNDYWSTDTGYDDMNAYYKHQMFTKNTLDTCITGIIKSMLNNMNPDYSPVANGRRFIDYAAQYAYYAYPYSNEQAQFVDSAVEYQLNAVTTLMMMYQDFVAHRADYFEEMITDESTDNSYTKTWTQLVSFYEDIEDSYTKAVGKFLDGEIYLPDINAVTTLDKYARSESLTDCHSDVKSEYTLTNTSYLSKRKYNGNVYSMADMTNPDKNTLTFYKNASVRVVNGELCFTPFYVLNGNAVDINKMFLSSFDINDENSWGTVFGGLFDTHYLNTDYYNLSNGKYSDGLNTYTPVSDVSQLKGLINETYYSANCSSPYEYFESYLGYGSDNPVYLLLNGKATMKSKPSQTRYTEFPVFNMTNSMSFSTTWESEIMSQYYLQSDRKGSDNKTNSMFCVILTATSDKTKSKVTTELFGEGEIKISGVDNSTAVAGEKVTLEINAPENYRISEITAQYYNGSDIVAEKTLSSGIDTNSLTLDFPVPYSDINITVKTEQIPSALQTDENGNFIVSSTSDLSKMADMVNSGYTPYAYGNYILTDDVAFEDNATWSTPIGTEERPFKGTFDGMGHTISNVFLDPDAQYSDFGLFGTVVGGSIVNLHLNMFTYAVYCNHTNLGPLCGYIENSNITNCTVDGHFCGVSDYLGAVVGQAKNSVIKNCESTQWICTDKYAQFGDICGYNFGSEIIDCTSDNTVVK